MSNPSDYPDFAPIKPLRSVMQACSTCQFWRKTRTGERRCHNLQAEYYTLPTLGGFSCPDGQAAKGTVS